MILKGEYRYNKEREKMSKKFHEVFDDNFLEKLNAVAAENGVNDLKLKDEEIDEKIDIKSLLTKMGFKVEFESIAGGSGQIHDKEIKINNTDVETRQRFSMAHELGHAYRKNREAARREDISDYLPDQMEEEVFANKFAAQLLMPRQLLAEYTEEIIAKNQLNPGNLERKNVDDIVAELAEKFDVSQVSMKFRVENVRLFTDVES